MQETQQYPAASSQRPSRAGIDLSAAFGLIFRHKVRIGGITLLGIAAGLILALALPKSYTATASFFPPSSSSTGASALMMGLGHLGLSAGSGLSLSGLNDTSLVYIDVLQSRTVADSLIRRFHLEKAYRTRLLSGAERALARHTKMSVGKGALISISVRDSDPHRAADIANGYLAELMKQNDRMALTTAAQSRLFFGKQLQIEKDKLADAEVKLAQTEHQTGLVYPLGQTQAQIASISRIRQEIIGRETQLAALSQGDTLENPDVTRLQSEIAGLRSQLSRLEVSPEKHRVAGSGSRESQLPELTLEYVRQERNVQYQEALYQVLLRQYAAASLSEARSAPIVQVVDHAVVPDSKSFPPRTLLVLLGAVLGFGVGVVSVLSPAIRNQSIYSKL